MNDVNWWLFGLSFATGLVFTLALMVRRVKHQVPVGVSADKPAEFEPQTTPIPVENEYPTTSIPVEKEYPTTKVPIAEQSPTTNIPAAKKLPPRRPPAAKESPTTRIPTARNVPPRKAPAAKGSPTQKLPKLPFAPYGPGSARATLSGGGPDGWLVKGRTDTRLYYTPDDPAYDETIAQVWFKNEESAVRAHFTPWRKSSRK
jgi:hypothetical protein